MINTIAKTEQSTAVDIIEINNASVLLSNLSKGAKNRYNYSYKNQMGTGQKNIQYVNYDSLLNTSSNSSFYSRELTFTLPCGAKSGYLEQILLECTLNSTGSNVNCLDRIGSRLFSKIYLETINGKRLISYIDPNYINARLDALQIPGTQFETCTNPDQLWNPGTQVTVYCPLFFNIFEDPGLFLDLSIVEALQIRVITAPNANAIGLVSDITSFSLRAMCTFRTMDDYNLPTKQFIKVMQSNDMYNEKPVALQSLSTNVEIPITCKFPILAVYVQIYDTSNNYTRPNIISLRTSENRVLDINTRPNFSMFETKTTVNNNMTLVHWFTLDQTRISQQTGVNLKELYNSSLYVQYDQVPNANYSIYVSFEYYNTIIVDKNGIIHKPLLF